MSSLKEKALKSMEVKKEKPKEIINESESQETITEPKAKKISIGFGYEGISKEPLYLRNGKVEPSTPRITVKKVEVSKLDKLDSYTLLQSKDLINYGYRTIHNKKDVREYENLIANNQEIPERLMEMKYVQMYIRGKQLLRHIREIDGLE